VGGDWIRKGFRSREQEPYLPGMSSSGLIVVLRQRLIPVQGDDRIGRCIARGDLLSFALANRELPGAGFDLDDAAGMCQ
jgi:hypothetical protein